MLPILLVLLNKIVYLMFYLFNHIFRNFTA